MSRWDDEDDDDDKVDIPGCIAAFCLFLIVCIVVGAILT